MSTKIKTAFLIVIMASLLLFVCVGAMVPAYAEAPALEQATEVEIEPTTAETDKDSEEPALSIEELAERFKTYLIGKFGEDYEFYYNQIIEQWGSIEGYLLAFGEKLPEEHQSGWDKFVGWMRNYWSIWATLLAIVIIIIIAIVGKKVFNSVIERTVNAKLKPIVKELNLHSTATIAIIHSQKALLPVSDKFAETVKELENAEKGLKNG